MARGREPAFLRAVFAVGYGRTLRSALDGIRETDPFARSAQAHPLGNIRLFHQRHDGHLFLHRRAGSVPLQPIVSNQDGFHDPRRNQRFALLPHHVPPGEKPRSWRRRPVTGENHGRSLIGFLDWCADLRPPADVFPSAVSLVSMVLML